MMFVFYLGNDPYKALKIARNKDEILEAKKAIDELEAVSLNTHANTYATYTTYTTKLTQTNTHRTHSPTSKQVRQSTRASLTSSIDLTAEDEAETDELPDIEPVKKPAKKPGSQPQYLQKQPVLSLRVLREEEEEEEEEELPEVVPEVEGPRQALELGPGSLKTRTPLMKTPRAPLSRAKESLKTAGTKST